MLSFHRYEAKETINKIYFLVSDFSNMFALHNLIYGIIFLNKHPIYAKKLSQIQLLLFLYFHLDSKSNKIP